MVDQRGYTLVESMCALTIMTIMLSAVFVGRTGSTQVVSSSYQELVASTWASGQLENLRTERALKACTREIEIDGDLQQQLANPHAQLWIMEREPGLFEITIELAWHTVGRHEDSVVRLTSLLAPELSR